jgi:phage gpG-like protein
MTGISVTTDKLKNILEKLNSFKRLEVLIGIPTDLTTRKPSEDEEIESSNAELGFIHEFGSPLDDIPKRPFLVPGVKKVKSKLTTILKKAAKNFTGEGSPIKLGLEQAGTVARDASKNIIVTQENFTPLSAKTIALRKRKNFDGEKALIRTAQLLNSITYVVREK